MTVEVLMTVKVIVVVVIIIIIIIIIINLGLPHFGEERVFNETR
jgi:preprotein translocase subunit SecE